MMSSRLLLQSWGARASGPTAGAASSWAPWGGWATWRCCRGTTWWWTAPRGVLTAGHRTSTGAKRYDGMFHYRRESQGPRDTSIRWFFFFLRADKTVFTMILGRKQNAIRQKGFIVLRCLHKGVMRRGSGSTVLSLSATLFLFIFPGNAIKWCLAALAIHWWHTHPLPHSLTRSLNHTGSMVFVFLSAHCFLFYLF